MEKYCLSSGVSSDDFAIWNYVIQNSKDKLFSVIRQVEIRVPCKVHGDKGLGKVFYPGRRLFEDDGQHVEPYFQVGRNKPPVIRFQESLCRRHHAAALVVINVYLRRYLGSAFAGLDLDNMQHVPLERDYIQLQMPCAPVSPHNLMPFSDQPGAGLLLSPLPDNLFLRFHSIRKLAILFRTAKESKKSATIFC